MSLEDELMESVNDGLACPCHCGFRVFEDGGNWAEVLEQHVRWIHVRNRDFGDDPITALFAMVANGLIRPDEFAALTRDVIQGEIDKLDAPADPRRQRKGAIYLTVGGASSVGALFALFVAVWLDYPAVFVLVQVGILVAFAMSCRIARLLFAPSGDVRPGLYPDTSNADAIDDQGGK